MLAYASMTGNLEAGCPQTNGAGSATLPAGGPYPAFTGAYGPRVRQNGTSSTPIQPNW
jgi:hypothetical protein